MTRINAETDKAILESAEWKERSKKALVPLKRISGKCPMCMQRGSVAKCFPIPSERLTEPPKHYILCCEKCFRGPEGENEHWSTGALERLLDTCYRQLISFNQDFRRSEVVYFWTPALMKLIFLAEPTYTNCARNQVVNATCDYNGATWKAWSLLLNVVGASYTLEDGKKHD